MGMGNDAGAAMGGRTGGGTGGGSGVGGATGLGGTTGGLGGAPATGFYHMERLVRGVVAVRVAGGNYVGWRMFGYEYSATNPTNVSYNVYRDGTRIAGVTDSTNYLDASGTATSSYTVRPVIAGAEGADSEAATPWAQQYLRVPLQVPPGGNMPASCTLTPNEAYTYSANDASVGDVDGDGRYEIILKWDPSNSKDNSQSGCTGGRDHRRLPARRHAPVAHRPRAQHPPLGAHYNSVHGLRLRRRREGRDGGQEPRPAARDGTGQFLHTGPAASDNDATSYRTDSTGYVFERAGVSDGVQRHDRRRDGDGRLRRAARHGRLVGRHIRQPRRCVSCRRWPSSIRRDWRASSWRAVTTRARRWRRGTGVAGN